jgi:dolichol-phosphate mannosyltransferase
VSYSLIIPIYNEIKTLPILLKQLQTLESVNEIILIDDGSTDGSQNILNYHCDLNEIILIKNKFNLGKGHSIKKGLEIASSANVILADADLEIDIKAIPLLKKEHELMLNEPKANNVLVGVRKPPKNQSGLTLINLGNKLINFIFNIIYKSNFEDILCCLKIINKSQILNFNLSSKGFEIETEIMAKIAQNSFKVKQVNIEYKPRSVEDGKKIKKIDSYYIFKKMINEKFIR